MKDKSNIVKRSPMRIRIHSGAEATVSIVDVLGQSTESSSTRVMLHDLGPYGMEFLTHLRFPVSDNYSLRVLITLGDWQFSVIGNIKWRSTDENQYKYGCDFVPDRGLRLAIVRALGDRLREKLPAQLRIHELYRQMSEQIGGIGYYLDMRR